MAPADPSRPWAAHFFLECSPLAGLEELVFHPPPPPIAMVRLAVGLDAGARSRHVRRFPFLRPFPGRGARVGRVSRAFPLSAAGATFDPSARLTGRRPMAAGRRFGGKKAINLRFLPPPRGSRSPTRREQKCRDCRRNSATRPPPDRPSGPSGTGVLFSVIQADPDKFHKSSCRPLQSKRA